MRRLPGDDYSIELSAPGPQLLGAMVLVITRCPLSLSTWLYVLISRLASLDVVGLEGGHLTVGRRADTTMQDAFAAAGLAAVRARGSREGRRTPRTGARAVSFNPHSSH